MVFKFDIKDMKINEKETECEIISIKVSKKGITSIIFPDYISRGCVLQYTTSEKEKPSFMVFSGEYWLILDKYITNFDTDFIETVSDAKIMFYAYEDNIWESRKKDLLKERDALKKYSNEEKLNYLQKKINLFRDAFQNQLSINKQLQKTIAPNPTTNLLLCNTYTNSAPIPQQFSYSDELIMKYLIQVYKAKNIDPEKICEKVFKTHPLLPEDIKSLFKFYVYAKAKVEEYDNSQSEVKEIETNKYTKFSTEYKAKAYSIIVDFLTFVFNTEIHPNMGLALPNDDHKYIPKDVFMLLSKICEIKVKHDQIKRLFN